MGISVRTSTNNRGFFDASLSNERKKFYSFLVKVFVLSTIGLFGILSIYYGAYLRQRPNLRRLTVRVIDLDTNGVLGPVIMNAVQEQNDNDSRLGWSISTQAEKDPAEAVQNEDYWAVLVVNANATSAALAATGSTFDGSGALSLYYSESRNYDTVDQYLVNGVMAVITPALATANANMASRLIGANSATSPALTRAFGLTSINIRPFTAYAGIAATSVGMLYLIIFVFIALPAFFGALGPMETNLTTQSVVTVKLVYPFIAYAFISLWFALVSYAFHLPFDKHYNKHLGFFVYYLLCYVTMLANGFVMEFVFILLGPLFFPFFLIFWVIVNVSVAFIAVEDQAHFYLYAYASPIYNAVQGSHCLIYGTKSHLAQNLGINLGWVFTFMFLCGIALVYQRRAADRKSIDNPPKDK